MVREQGAHPVLLVLGGRRVSVSAAALSRLRLACSMAAADVGRGSGSLSALSGGVTMPGITEASRPFLRVTERPPAPRQCRGNRQFRGSAPLICPGFRLGFPGRVGHA